MFFLMRPLHYIKRSIKPFHFQFSTLAPITKVNTSSSTSGATVSKEELLDVLYSKLSRERRDEPVKLSAKVDQAILASIKSDLISRAEKASDKQSNLLRDIYQRPAEQQLSIKHINQVILLNAIAQRPLEAQKAFEMLDTLGISPNIESFNYLMKAYAIVNDSATVCKLFDEMKRKGCSPSDESYSIVIDALVSSQKLEEAFNMESLWRKQGVLLPQHVYTSLMRGSIKRNKFAKTEAVFDYMRSHITQPDEVAFTLMISAFAKRGDTEKALDLFTQMADYKIPYTRETFHYVILALINRSDYYPSVHEKLDIMQEYGFKMDTRLRSMLIYGASRYGDIVLGRRMWNEMMDQYSAEAEAQPTIRDITNMIMMCAKYIKRPITFMNQESDHVDEVPFVLKDNKLRLSTTCMKNSQVALQAEALYKYAIEHVFEQCENESHQMKLLNGYLKFLSTSPLEQHCHSTMDFFESEFHRFHLAPNGFTFTILLSYLSRPKNLNESQTNTVWQRYSKWDQEQEAQLDALALLPRECEEKRQEQGRGIAETWKKFLYRINIYTRLSMHEKALECLAESREFRQPGYLPSVKFEDIRELIQVAKDKGEDGDVNFFKRIQELCPRENNPLQLIQKKLVEKNRPKNWWGWKALGIGKKRRDQIMHQ